MVIFKPTAILVYFKKKILKIDPSYHIQQKYVVSSLLCWAENKSVSNFFGLKYQNTCVGEFYVGLGSGVGGGGWFGLLGWVFFSRKHFKWFGNGVHLKL